MSPALQALVASGALTASQARAAAMWSADLDATGGAAPKPGAGRRSVKGPANVMASAARARLRAFENRCGGRGSRWYRIAYLALHVGHGVEAVAQLLDQEPLAVRGVVRLAGQTLAGIYQSGEG